jgi:uncharacterized membrane-anchored protein YhcB (DUF1043 family)
MQPEEESQKLREIKHDIKNQLSNVYFAIDQLRHELSTSDASSFAAFCVDTIANSCQAINKHIEELN